MIPEEQHEPCRGDDVEAWLKRERDGGEARCNVIDQLLDRYRECSDYGLSLRPEHDELGDP